MNTPEAEPQADTTAEVQAEIETPEPPVTPEERKLYERIVGGINHFYKRRQKHDPVTGKTWYEPAFTNEEVDKFLDAFEHIARRLKMEYVLVEAYNEWRDRMIWKSVIPPVKREPVKPLPLP